MAFEIVQTTRGGGLANHPGHCRMSRSGFITFLLADLTAAGISDKATLLIDCETLRIALRAPLKGEPSVTVCKTNATAQAMRKIATRSATNKLGLSRTKNLITMPVKVQDDMLIVQLNRKDFEPQAPAPEASPLEVNPTQEAVRPPTPAAAAPVKPKVEDEPHPSKSEIPFKNLAPPSTIAKRRYD